MFSVLGLRVISVFSLYFFLPRCAEVRGGPQVHVSSQCDIHRFNKASLIGKKVIIIHVMVMGVTAVVFIGPPRIFHMNYTIFFNRIFYTREVFEGLC
jgi:hypothetical protein